MARTLTVRTIVTENNTTNVVDDSVSYSAAMPILVDAEAIAGSATTVINVAIDVSATKVIVFRSSVACTIKTNSADTPDDTIPLVANLPYTWHTTSYDTNKVTADVTSLHVVVAGATAGTLTVIGLVDPTP